MSQWKGPFEELYYKALSDGAKDIADMAEKIFRDAGLDEQLIRRLTETFKDHADTVHERHAYSRGTLDRLPSVPRTRKPDPGPFYGFYPG